MVEVKGLRVIDREERKRKNWSSVIGGENVYRRGFGKGDGCMDREEISIEWERGRRRTVDFLYVGGFYRYYRHGKEALIGIYLF